MNLINSMITLVTNPSTAESTAKFNIIITSTFVIHTYITVSALISGNSDDATRKLYQS